MSCPGDPHRIARPEPSAVWACVSTSKDQGSRPKISPEDRLRVQVTIADQSFILEGRMRNPAGPQDTPAIITGVTFKKLEDNLEGRQILAQLTRTVGELQAAMRVRRYRMGMLKAG